MEVITGIVSELGFPIAMVVYFIWDKNNTNKSMIKAINTQNKILNKILIKLGCYDLIDEESEEMAIEE